MEARDAVEVVRLFAANGIDVWLDGDGDVDALLGKQTSPHDGLDVVVGSENAALRT